MMVTDFLARTGTGQTPMLPQTAKGGELATQSIAAGGKSPADRVRGVDSLRRLHNYQCGEHDEIPSMLFCRAKSYQGKRCPQRYSGASP
jgi:hypothetical protein